jgi:uncharacterized membrane protein
MTEGMTTLAKGDTSGIVDPERTVVRDELTWRALWSAHAGADAEAPDVDFTTRMVAAAFAGERPTPGYGVEILEPRQEGASLVMPVREEQPARGMLAAQIIVTPYHIVTLPRHDGALRFIDATGSPFRGGQSVVAPQPPGGSNNDPAIGRSPHASSAATPSSTGLEPNFAAALAYLAGPFSGILILLVERANGFVRFHAWQAIVGLGGLGLLSAGTLVFSFLTLLLSPFAFTVMYWLSGMIALVWVVVWVFCLIKAFSGERWHMPVAGRYAERLAATEKH